MSLGGNGELEPQRNPTPDCPSPVVDGDEDVIDSLPHSPNAGSPLFLASASLPVEAEDGSGIRVSFPVLGPFECPVAVDANTDGGEISVAVPLQPHVNNPQLKDRLADVFAPKESRSKGTENDRSQSPPQDPSDSEPEVSAPHKTFPRGLNCTEIAIVGGWPASLARHQKKRGNNTVVDNTPVIAAPVLPLPGQASTATSALDRRTLRPPRSRMLRRFYRYHIQHL
ncbi:hypothetical protein NMY22_g14385 [Coprinellus aureogranulatus]|nr:hypothetical protein NMY22_g14385 [Coprinellus aureogranulatus]